MSTTVSFDELLSVIQSALLRAGMAAPDAATCARIHAESTLDGVNSHGLNRVPRFVDYIQRGWINLHGAPQLVKQFGAIELYDGQRAPGILNAIFATDRAITLAQQHGVAIVTLRNTTHWMRGGAYGWRAAERGLLAMSWTNTESCMPPWGARNPRIGNNPFVIAVPRPTGHVVLDMAMSQYSYGKLQTTRLNGRKLPFPGGFDASGNLTDDPAPIEQSMRILPMGYWKGSGFAIMLDLLAAILSEGATTAAIDQIGQGSCTGCSQVFILIDPSQSGNQLNGTSLAAEVADSVVDYLHQSTPDEHGASALYPGENALRTRLHQRQHGISVDPEIWQQVLQLAGSEAQ